jgi:hypothetical protein
MISSYSNASSLSFYRKPPREGGFFNDGFARMGLAEIFRAQIFDNQDRFFEHGVAEQAQRNENIFYLIFLSPRFSATLRLRVKRAI